LISENILRLDLSDTAHRSKKDIRIRYLTELEEVDISGISELFRHANPFPEERDLILEPITISPPNFLRSSNNLNPSFNLSNSSIVEVIALKMEREEIAESPRKRLKVDNVQNEDDDIVVVEVPAVESSSSSNTQATREVDVGITEFVSADIPGFEGVLKKRCVNHSRKKLSNGLLTAVDADTRTFWLTKSFRLARCFICKTSKYLRRFSRDP
jgi:hypothetical protein